MIRRWALAALIVLPSACGTQPGAVQHVPWNSEAGGTPAVLRRSAPPPPAERDQVLPERVVPADLPPDRFVPPYPPAPHALPPPNILPVQAPPAPAPNFAPALPSGPVTNYGTGGMQALPGAPPNPPYPSGGLMH